MLNFIFCVHNHQPVGNFDHVIEDAATRSYEPFLKELLSHPEVKLSYHVTGFLLDWLVEKRPACISMLKTMVERGQVEMLGGAYYEPVLAVIPVSDRLAQIEKMSLRLEELFGCRPRGMWLAERVWDPTLPPTLSDAGIEYVVVDDYHFIKSGLSVEDLYGYYVTEDLGKSVKVFAGSERLRYLIPFEETDKLDDYLRSVDNSQDSTARAITFADDGEKFGVWPGTDKWVFDEGWLKDFLEKISALKDVVRSVTFSEHMDSVASLGRVYLPTTSYMEMGEWSLPAEASSEYAILREAIKHCVGGEGALRFFQGGTWRNFFSKYSEADWMHKRMLEVSSLVSDAATRGLEDKDITRAKEHLYKAESNDAYWHGVFGGLYLPHLRCAVYENLIKAESLAKPILMGAQAEERRSLPEEVTVEVRDVNADGIDEVVINTRDISLYLSPEDGGTLTEMDFKAGAINVMNTLSRYREGYHKKLEEACKAEEARGDNVTSIHGNVAVKEEGLDGYLFFDAVKRASLRERFFSGEVELTVDAFRKSELTELGGFSSSRFECEVIEGSGVVLSRKGDIDGRRVSLEKRLSVSGAVVKSDYTMSAEGGKPLGNIFTVEFNFLLPGCNGPVSYVESAGERAGLSDSKVFGSSKELRLVDEFAATEITLKTSRPVKILAYPIETVSLSEGGFERIYQGTSIVIAAPVTLNHEKKLELSIEVGVKSL